MVILVENIFKEYFLSDVLCIKVCKNNQRNKKCRKQIDCVHLYEKKKGGGCYRLKFSYSFVHLV